MKLSEAILLGSVGTEQAYGCSAIMPNGKATCALGAALFAIGESLAEWRDGIPKVTARWPWADKMVPIPSAIKRHCEIDRIYVNTAVYDVIWRLNDYVRWTRPQIAAWVADLEQTYDPDPVPVAVLEPVHESVPVQ